MGAHQCQRLPACALPAEMLRAPQTSQVGALPAASCGDHTRLADATPSRSISPQPIYGFDLPADHDLPAAAAEPQSSALPLATPPAAAAPIASNPKQRTSPGLLSKLMAHQEPAPCLSNAFASKRRALAPAGKVARVTWGPRQPSQAPASTAAATTTALPPTTAAHDPSPLAAPSSAPTSAPSNPTTPRATPPSASPHALSHSPTLTHLDALLALRHTPPSTSLTAPFIPPAPLHPCPPPAPAAPPAPPRRIPHCSSEPSLHIHTAPHPSLPPTLPASHPSNTSSSPRGPEAPGTPTRRDAMASMPSLHLRTTTSSDPPRPPSHPAPAPTPLSPSPTPTTPTSHPASSPCPSSTYYSPTLSSPPSPHPSTPAPPTQPPGMRRIHTRPSNPSSTPASTPTHPSESSPSTPTISLHPTPRSPLSPLDRPSPRRRTFPPTHPPHQITLPAKLLAMMPKTAPPPTFSSAAWRAITHPPIAPPAASRGALAPAGSDDCEPTPPTSPAPPTHTRFQCAHTAFSTPRAAAPCAEATAGRPSLPCQHTTDLYRGLDEQSLDALCHRWQPYRTAEGGYHLDLRTMAAHIHDARLAQARRTSPDTAPPLRTPRPCLPHDRRTQWWCGRKESGFADSMRPPAPASPPPATASAFGIPLATPRGLRRILSGLFGPEQ